MKKQLFSLIAGTLVLAGTSYAAAAPATEPSAPIAAQQDCCKQMMQHQNKAMVDQLVQQGKLSKSQAKSLQQAMDEHSAAMAAHKDNMMKDGKCSMMKSASHTPLQANAKHDLQESEQPEKPAVPDQHAGHGSQHHIS